MFKFFISIFVLFISLKSFSQENKIEKDTLLYKSPYGIRLGIDISKPLKTSFQDNYSGLELVGDYRISEKIYIAAEIGYEEETSKEDFTNSTAKGSYLRVGFNFNAYENWLDMNNEIFLGFRYGLSFFDQTLNEFTPNVNTTYFPANQITNAIQTNNLTAHWTEFMAGIKVETFKNFFISSSISFKMMISVKDPDNFKSLYAPGFNRIFASNSGFGFNYTLSYLIPFKKK